MSRHVKYWLVVCVLAAGYLGWQRGCEPTLDAIVVDDGVVVVRNQSAEEWRSVRIWVNDYYGGGAQSIPAGGFVREPLSRFVTGHLQPFNPVNTAVTSVVVLATAPDGTKVRIVHGKPGLR